MEEMVKKNDDLHNIFRNLLKEHGYHVDEYGIIIDPKHLWGAKGSLPARIGLDINGYEISLITTAFINYTRRYIISNINFCNPKFDIEKIITKKIIPILEKAKELGALLEQGEAT